MVRAKFRVNFITDHAGGAAYKNQQTGEVYPAQVGNKEIQLGAVWSSDPNHENRKYWEATPSGAITLNIKSDKPAAHWFKPGKEYYVTFEEAPDSV